MLLNIDPKVDFAFKWVFGREGCEIILIALLNAVLALPPGKQITQIRLLDPFNLKDAADAKLSILDIKARDQSGRQFNIEMQMLGYFALPGRLLYYWAELYTQQLHEGEEYEELAPTISVCFVDSVLFPEIERYHTCYHIREDECGRILTPNLEMHLLELPKFTKSIEEVSTALDGWLYFLRHAQELDPEALPDPIAGEELRQAMEALKVLSQTGNERLMYEARLKEARDERARLSAALREGEEKGVEKGVEKGIEKGIVIGKIQMMQRVLKSEVAPRDQLDAMTVEELQRLHDALSDQIE